MPEQDVRDFYDAMADDYHLIFADWAQSVVRQGVVLDNLIHNYLPEQNPAIHVLDCACGIGTQAIGLAQRGYQVHATDISPVEIQRAEQEAQKMGVQLTFGIADMRFLSQQVQGQFDVVLAFDNAIPHLLTDDDLAQAVRHLLAVTRSGGLFMASIRDYDALLEERPQINSERVMDSADGRRVTLQVWDWDGESYAVTQFILLRHDDDWQMRHYTTRYRALRRQTLTTALQAAGFDDIQWLMPEGSGFYQPVVVARRR